MTTVRLALVTVATLVGVPAQAAGPPVSAVGRAGLELAAGTHARAGRNVSAPSPAPPTLRRALGPAWASWDRDTGVPSRIVLGGVEAPGTIASPIEAERFARAFLSRHIDLLAPGCAAHDFVVVANDLSAGIRSVGFAQTSAGLRVLDGQLSFRFKADRLTVVGSEAMPHVAVPVRAASATIPTAKATALAWLRDSVAGRTHASGATDGPYVLPIVTSGRVEYREVLRSVVDVEQPRSRWAVYLDAETAQPVAREQLLAFATTELQYNVPLRGPLGIREDLPAPFVGVRDGLALALTDETGVVDLLDPSNMLETSVSGPFVAVTNIAGDAAAAILAVEPTTVWDARGDEQVDAQLSAFVHASRAKTYVRAIAPGLPWLDTQLQINVNINDECNAFSDGNTINFFLSSDSCENTARLADVVYHEFGHSLHNMSLIQGVGLFDRALSEGYSDYLSATIVGDASVAPGFFYNDAPLRDLDPAGFEYRWPDDRGEVHGEGRIIGGALWDLRKILIAKYGPTQGVAITDRLWYEATRRAVDIPSMYTEALLVDDDDGNLANGTPNACQIIEAFGPHGLYSAGEDAELVERLPGAQGHRIELSLSVPEFPGCPVSVGPVLEWKLRDEPPDSVTAVAMGLTGGRYVAVIPTQPSGSVVQYRVKVNYSSGTERSLPDNYVDPFYEFYEGEVVPLYCTGFEELPDDWTLGNAWAFGLPNTGEHPSDPEAAFDGAALHIDGGYPSFTDTEAVGPVVGTQGYPQVRLQYWRWLTVEDGFFDQARVTVDGAQVWSNHATGDEDFATFHHTDREWRFHDVEISEHAADGAVQVAFGLASDGGLELGGWSVDGICIVGVGAPVGCGDGVLGSAEACDDGNLADGDGCSALCELEGDDGGDDGDEPGDDDPDGDDGSALDDDSGLVGRGCGCSSGADLPAALWLFALGAVRRKKRM